MSNQATPHGFAINPRNQVKRLPERGHYDREIVYQIIDEALVCQVAFVQDNQPFMIPTLHARDGDELLLHGAKTSRLLKHIQSGNSICVSMTLVDGIVLAKSAFHHSINYRSVVLFGKGHVLEGETERLHALELFTEHIMPGRWQAVRPPSAPELKATMVVSIPIELASAKVRTGPPKDDEADFDLPIWSGILPLRQIALAPISADARDIPPHVADFVKRKSVEE